MTRPHCCFLIALATASSVGGPAEGAATSQGEAPPTPLIRDFTVTNPDREPDQSLLTRKYTEESLAFVRRHAGKRPFFLYLAHTMPHVPLYASRDFKGRSRRSLYGDTIEEIDWSAGRILHDLHYGVASCRSSPTSEDGGESTIRL